MRYSSVFCGTELPDVLVDEEFRFYFDKFKSGDMEARNILINHNIRLVLMVIQKYFSHSTYEFEELLSTGMFGLIKAIDTYDIDRDNKLSAYASKCIKNEILMYIRKNKKDEDYTFVAFDDYISTDGESFILSEVIADSGIDMESKFIDVDLLMYRNVLINQLMECLSDIEREAIMMKFGFKDGKIYLQEDIARVINVSRPHVSKVLARALEKIKKEF